jgi:hypothetical protein
MLVKLSDEILFPFFVFGLTRMNAEFGICSSLDTVLLQPFNSDGTLPGGGTNDVIDMLVLTDGGVTSGSSWRVINRFLSDFLLVAICHNYTRW